jgi:mRNA interferase RelE/StbE
MSYHVEFTERAKKSLQKLDKHNAKTIYAWIAKNLEGIENPYSKGKALIADKKGQWRYRVGNFRLVCEIIDDRLVILVLELGDRKSIYKPN